MFTGLIAEVGRVATAADKGTRRGGRRISIAASEVTRGLKPGASVAVNGVCLTALEITGDRFEADLAAETVARTSLSQLAPGTPVNLELPVAAGMPLGGHIVQGHVDGVARILRLEKRSGGKDWLLVVELPKGLESYVVAQGSVAIEGISLTVAEVKDRRLRVAVIPHTYRSTNLESLRRGDPVNIEVDVMAKYAEKVRSGAASSSGITLERLLSEGF